MTKASRAFRAGLRRELPIWVEQGLVDPDGARHLTRIYRLDEDGRHLASVAAYGLGALLCGGGVISLVAWNWDAIPDAIKVLVVTGLSLAASIIGYRLFATERSPRLGQGLLLLGTLVFGADIGLVAQVFNVSDHWYNGFGGWALGAITMAYAVRSIPLGALAAVLGTVWAIPFTDDHHSLFALPPLLMLAGLLPLALFSRSRLVFALSAIAPLVAYVAAALEQGESAAAFTLPVLTVGSLLASASLGERRRWYAGTAVGVAIVLFLSATYLSSFIELADDLPLRESDATVFAWIALPLGVAAAGCLVARLAYGISLAREALGITVTVASAGLVLLVIADGEGGLTMIAANLALAAFAGASIHRSIDRLERGPFWLGVVVAAATIVSRFLELETGLLFKGIGFLGAGAAVILLGLLFEGRVRERRAHA